MKDMDNQVTAYLKRQVSSYHEWSKNKIKDMVQFYKSLGQLIVSQDKDGKVNGALGFQFLNSINDINDSINDWNSEGIHIQFLAVDNKEVRAKIMQQLIAVSGFRFWVSFERAKYGQRLSVLPFDCIERMASYGRTS